MSCNGGTVIFESGPDTTNKTSLSLTGKGLTPGQRYRARVRYVGSGGCSEYSPWVEFVMAPCEDQPDDCPEPPPAPPAPPPGPPAPTPTPVPPAPPGPDGNPAFVLDASASSILGDLYCLDNAITFNQIAVHGYKIIGTSGSLIVVVKNVGTATGTATVQVTSDHADLTVSSPLQSASIAAGAVGTFSMALNLVGSGPGAFTLSIDTGAGAPYTVILSATGSTDCGGGGD